jgi:hypothetical protein
MMVKGSASTPSRPLAGQKDIKIGFVNQSCASIGVLGGDPEQGEKREWLLISATVLPFIVFW